MIDETKGVSYRKAAVVLVGAWAVTVAACFGLFFAFRSLVGALK